jgi:hypothetical protein
MDKAEHAVEIIMERRAELIAQETAELLRDLDAIELRIIRLELALRSLAGYGSRLQ